LWSAAPDGEPTHVNQRILDYGGMRFEDFLNLGWKEFIHPDDFSETAAAFAEAIQTGQPYQAVHRLRRVDGQYRWHHARGEPLRDAEQRIIQWYGVSVDIDELKRAEDALRGSEARFRDYAETASDWFWEMGPDYKFTLLTGNALVRIQRNGLARRAGITLLILKRNRRSGVSCVQPLMRANHFVTSCIARRTAAALRCT
jgi:PAS domain S-box-containing protein